MNSYNTDVKNNIKKNENYKNHNHLTSTNFVDIYIDVYASSIEFYSRLNSAFIDAVSVPFTDAREEIRKIRNEIKPKEFFNYTHQQQELDRKIEKTSLSKIRNKFDTNFREKTFIDSLSEFVESYSNLVNITGIGFIFQNIFNLNSFWNNVFIEPIRDTWGRTSSHKINLGGNHSLMHYDIHQQEEGHSSENNNIKQRSKITKETEKETTKRNLLILLLLLPC